MNFISRFFTGDNGHNQRLNHYDNNSNQNGWNESMRIYPFINQMDYVPQELEYGGKIGLSSSSLASLYESSTTSKIFMLEIMNIATNKKMTVGVAPQTFVDGCYAPTWLMQQLGVEPGQLVLIRSIQCPTIKEAVLQPVEHAFTELSDPRTVLQNTLLNHTCLTVGQTIICMYLQREYEINVISLEPTDAVCIIDCDLPYHMLDALDAPMLPPPVVEDVHNSGYVRGMRVPTDEPWKVFDENKDIEDNEDSSPSPVPWESQKGMEEKQLNPKQIVNDENKDVEFIWGNGSRI
eukprot:TRINITY_DN2281_c0_g3_i1.p1 TRINITY_DN2281_c0_g3~~TRINITY_DN2281_c0_g3_i1.p1  ORF type:complete len:292 (+),score=79.55 TRINITY_DN2281_c0_g3_i1:32-907(+)